MASNKPVPQSEKNKVQIQRMEARVEASSFRGPLPPPEILAHYEDVLPGAADRIITMAENQSAHRIEIEKTVINTRSRDSLLGICSGLTIGLAALGASIYVIVSGYPVYGSIIGTTGLGGLVGVFVYGTRENRSERERKDLQVK